MTSRCTIAAPLPESQWVTGPDGMQVPSYRLEHVDLPCRLSPQSQLGTSTSVTVFVGDASQEAAGRMLHLPHDRRVTDGAFVRIDEGEWVGTFWRLLDGTGADQMTALRVRVTQVDEPEGWGTWASA